MAGGEDNQRPTEGDAPAKPDLGCTKGGTRAVVVLDLLPDHGSGQIGKLHGLMGRRQRQMHIV